MVSLNQCQGNIVYNNYNFGYDRMGNIKRMNDNEYFRGKLSIILNKNVIVMKDAFERKYKLS